MFLDEFFAYKDYVFFGHKDEDSLDLDNSEILNSISMRLQQQTHEVYMCYLDMLEFFILSDYGLFLSVVAEN